MSQLASGNYVAPFSPPLTPSAPTTTVFIPDNAANPYESYFIETKYIWDNGTVAGETPA